VVRETVALSASRKSSIFGDSDRERVEGFHLTITRAVTTVATVVAEAIPIQIRKSLDRSGRSTAGIGLVMA